MVGHISAITAIYGCVVVCPSLVGSEQLLNIAANRSSHKQGSTDTATPSFLLAIN